MHDGDAERVRRATGKRPASLQPVAGHGAPSNRRWRATFDDGSSVFVKVAAFDHTADWLRLERATYEALAGKRYLSPLLGWDDDGEQPALVIEDHSAAQWPPPWSAARIDAVLVALEEIQATQPPPRISTLFVAPGRLLPRTRGAGADPTGAACQEAPARSGPRGALVGLSRARSPAALLMQLRCTCKPLLHSPPWPWHPSSTRTSWSCCAAAVSG